MGSWLELLPPLLDGARITAYITLVSAGLAFVASFAVGLARLASWWPMRALARAYCEVFRGTSLLVQLFYFFYVLPLLGVEMESTTTAIVALTANTAAYGAEVVRSTVASVDQGQRDAATALNMSRLLAFRRVIFPIAFMQMLPLFGNIGIALVKESSLVSLITIADLAFQGNQLFVLTGDAGRVFTLLLALYFCVCFPLSLGVRWLERRLALRPGAKAA